MEELEASYAPLQRSDLAGLTGLTELSLRGPDVDFRSWMGYPYWMFPYLLDAGLSGTRLAALLATSPQLRHLTLENRALYDLPKDFLAHNPRLQILSVAFGDFNKYNIYQSSTCSCLRACWHTILIWTIDTDKERCYVSVPADLLRYTPRLAPLEVSCN